MSESEPPQESDSSGKSTVELIREGRADGVAIEPSVEADPLSSLELTPEQIEAILARGHAKFVAIVGTVGSGKTTLLASIFHHLMAGKFAGVSFGGSLTLPAFARAVASITIHGGVDRPKVPRTERSPSYKGLHLRLWRERTRVVNYIFTDVAGDLYEEAQHSAAAAQALAFLRRADAVLVLLNGDTFGNPADRQTDLDRLIGILQRLVHVGSLSTNAPALLVFSKYDRWRDLGDAGGWTQHAYNAVVENLGFPAMSSLSVAALSLRQGRKPHLRSGHSVDKVLEFAELAPEYVVLEQLDASAFPEVKNNYLGYPLWRPR